MYSDIFVDGKKQNILCIFREKNSSFSIET